MVIITSKTLKMQCNTPTRGVIIAIGVLGVLLDGNYHI